MYFFFMSLAPFLENKQFNIPTLFSSNPVEQKFNRSLPYGPPSLGSFELPVPSSKRAKEFATRQIGKEKRRLSNKAKELFSVRRTASKQSKGETVGEFKTNSEAKEILRNFNDAFAQSELILGRGAPVGVPGGVRPLVMPRRYGHRGGYKRKRSFKRRGGRSGFYSRVHRIVRSVVKIETHKFDISHSGNVATTWTTNALTNIAQGVGIDQRDGLQIHIRYLKLHVMLQTVVQATPPPFQNGYARFVVLQDTQQSNAAPTAAQIFNSNDIYAFLAPSNAGRFIIIFDELLTHHGQIYFNSGVPATAYGTGQYYFKYFKRFPKSALATTYTTNAATDPQNGGLYCFHVTDRANLFTVDMRFRIGYTDS